MANGPGSYMPPGNTPQANDPTLYDLLVKLGAIRNPPSGSFSSNPPSGGVASGPAIANTMDSGTFSPYQPPHSPIQSNAGSGRAPTDTRPTGAGPHVKDERFAAGQSGSSAAPPNVGQRSQMGSTAPPAHDLGEVPKQMLKDWTSGISSLADSGAKMFMDRVMGGAGPSDVWHKIQTALTAGGANWQDFAKHMDANSVPIPEWANHAVANPGQAGATPPPQAAAPPNPGQPGTMPAAAPPGPPAAAPPAAAPAAPPAPAGGGGPGWFAQTGLGQLLGGGDIGGPFAGSPGADPLTAGRPVAGGMPPQPVGAAVAPAGQAAAVNGLASNSGTPPLPSPKPAIPDPSMANSGMTAGEAANLAAVGGPQGGGAAGMLPGAGAAPGMPAGAPSGVQPNKPDFPSSAGMAGPRQVDLQQLLALLGAGAPGGRSAVSPIGADLR